MGFSHGNDFKRLPLKLQVKIAIRGGVHNAPELALTGAIQFAARTDPFTVKTSSASLAPHHK